MAIINDKDRAKLQEKFAELVKPVKLVVFTQETECQFCSQNRELAQEIASISDLIHVTIRDFVTDRKEVNSLQIDKIPAIAVLGENDTDYGVRFYGIPAGYEFMSLVESIEMVSRGDSGLSSKSKNKLMELKNPIHLQVFVTPTCPYCPKAVLLAFQMAIESKHIRADMVEATEFPHLANKYNVSGVPHTVIGDSVQPMVGAYPEHAALELMFAAASNETR